MSDLDPHGRSLGTNLWSTSNNRQRECCQAILLAGLALATGLGSRRAIADSVKEGGAPTDRAQAMRRHRAPTARSARLEARPLGVEILGHAFLADVGVGALGVGVETVSMPWPNFGFGAELDTFGVDNGEYPRDGSIVGGKQLLVFAEADLLRGWFTPYLRFGGGPASYDRMVVPAHYSNNAYVDTSIGATAQVSVGIALRGGPFLLRLAASPTSVDGSWVAAYFAGVGLRF